MYYNDFRGLKLSALGFGTMRLPVLPGGGAGDINQDALEEMVGYAMEHGVNYYDTAAPYHEGLSEVAIGRALGKYPRDSFYLANKYPGHQIQKSYDPAATFEGQLKKCGVEYFDFYLMHNVNENSVGVYTDPKWGIHDYFKEQKALGRIRHLGFSCHGDVPCMEQFLEVYGDIAEFCQIQLNFLDWSLQNAEAKLAFLNGRSLPIWVMEPVRGGKLTKFDEEIETRMRALAPGRSIASWGFRWLQGLPGVTVVLSGMSDLGQMRDNVSTFSERDPLDERECALVFEAAETLKSSVPCTGCRYCCAGCPQALDIPRLIAMYNEMQVSFSVNIQMRYDALGEQGKADRCIGCGQCSRMCPQQIDVPEILRRIDEKISALPSWAEICRKREEAARKQKQTE